MLIKKLEDVLPFFIEDPISPENRHWMETIRQKSSVLIAMGEWFNNLNEWIDKASLWVIDTQVWD